MILPINANENPQKRYQVIYADPPWKYYNLNDLSPANDKFKSRGYNTLDYLEIIDLHLERFFDNSCYLFLWVTVPHLPNGVNLIKDWGFEYKTTLVWRKSFYKHPAGYWFKCVCEFLLVAKKGNFGAFHSELENVFFIEPTVASEKPSIFYDIIEKLTVGLDRLELFARKKRDNWDSWGNQL